MSGDDLESRAEPSTPESHGSSARDGELPPDDERLELASQVELLAAENRRLRAEYARLRQVRSRRTTLGLAGVGVVAALGGVAFPDAREVLFALAATGLFGAVLTYALSPTRFVAADVGERIYAVAAANVAAIGDALGLADEAVYLPGGGDQTAGERGVAPGAGSVDAPGGIGVARLYVPQHGGEPLLEECSRLADRDELDDLDGPFVTADDRRGLVIEPTGGPLYREFERELVDDLASDPGEFAIQLADALVEGFELADAATPDVDATDGRATVAVTGSALGDVDRLDHPIASFLAVGFAVGLERPISLEVVPDDGLADWLITCRWVPRE